VSEFTFGACVRTPLPIQLQTLAVRLLAAQRGLDLAGDEQRRRGAGHLLGGGDEAVLGGAAVHEAVGGRAQAVAGGGDGARRRGQALRPLALVLVVLVVVVVVVVARGSGLRLVFGDKKFKRGGTDLDLESIEVWSRVTSFYLNQYLP